MKSEAIREKIEKLDKKSVKYLLIQSQYELRTDLLKEAPTQAAKDLTFKGDVGSALFIYDGKHFGPFAAASKGSFATHSERESLLRTINEALKEKWGPFGELPFTSILSLPIEQIIGQKKQQGEDKKEQAEEEKYAKLIEVLKKLDKIHILSERESCNFQNNQLYAQAVDKGCALYLKELDELLGNNKIDSYSYLSGRVSTAMGISLVKNKFQELDKYFKTVPAKQASSSLPTNSTSSSKITPPAVQPTSVNKNESRSIPLNLPMVRLTKVPITNPNLIQPKPVPPSSSPSKMTPLKIQSTKSNIASRQPVFPGSSKIISSQSQQAQPGQTQPSPKPSVSSPSKMTPPKVQSTNLNIASRQPVSPGSSKIILSQSQRTQPGKIQSPPKPLDSSLSKMTLPKTSPISSDKADPQSIPLSVSKTRQAKVPIANPNLIQSKLTFSSPSKQNQQAQSGQPQPSPKPSASSPSKTPPKVQSTNPNIASRQPVSPSSSSSKAMPSQSQQAQPGKIQSPPKPLSSSTSKMTPPKTSPISADKADPQSMPLSASKTRQTKVPIANPNLIQSKLTFSSPSKIISSQSQRTRPGQTQPPPKSLGSSPSKITPPKVQSTDPSVALQQSVSPSSSKIMPLQNQVAQLPVSSSQPKLENKVQSESSSQGSSMETKKDNLLPEPSQDLSKKRPDEDQPEELIERLIRAKETLAQLAEEKPLNKSTKEEKPLDKPAEIQIEFTKGFLPGQKRFISSLQSSSKESGSSPPTSTKKSSDGDSPVHKKTK